MRESEIEARMIALETMLSTLDRCQSSPVRLGLLVAACLPLWKTSTVDRRRFASYMFPPLWFSCDGYYGLCFLQH